MWLRLSLLLEESPAGRGIREWADAEAAADAGALAVCELMAATLRLPSDADDADICGLCNHRFHA